jgi:hypothetical protein
MSLEELKASELQAFQKYLREHGGENFQYDVWDYYNFMGKNYADTLRQYGKDEDLAEEYVADWLMDGGFYQFDDKKLMEAFPELLYTPLPNCDKAKEFYDLITEAVTQEVTKHLVASPAMEGAIKLIQLATEEGWDELFPGYN